MKGFGRQCVEYINSTPKKQKEFYLLPFILLHNVNYFTH